MAGEQISAGLALAIEYGNDRLALWRVLEVPGEINLVVDPARLHRIRRNHHDEDGAGGNFLHNLTPPGVPAVQSSRDVIPDGMIITQFATQIDRQPHAKVVIHMAMADEDARWWSFRHVGAHLLRLVRHLYGSRLPAVRSV